MQIQLRNFWIKNAIIAFIGICYVGNITAQDTTPPTINNLSPISGATNVSAHLSAISFQITFNEFVSNTAGEARIRRTSDDSLIATNNIFASSIPSGQRNFNFAEPYGLMANTSYYIEVDANIFKDASGNQFDGINDKNVWTFTTEQAAPDFPALNAFGPAGGSPRPEDAVTDGLSFGLVFSRVIRGKSGRALLLETLTDKVVAVSTITQGTSYSTDGFLDFGDLILKTSTAYYVQIDAGYYEDVFGNEYAGINDKTTWAFTTKSTDGNNPDIASLTPSNSSTGFEVTRLSEDFYVSFDEKVSQVSGEARLIKTLNAEVISTSPLSNSNGPSTFHSFRFTERLLEANTTYHIEIDEGSFADVFGNKFPGITNSTTWTFNTKVPEVDKPLISSVDPADDLTNVTIALSDFYITYDELVSFNSGAIRLIKTSNGSIVPNGPSIVIDDNKTQQRFSMDQVLLEPSTQYHIEMDDNVFTDVFGNTSDGINDQTTWSFTTQGPESDVPQVSVFAPGTSSTIEVSSTFFVIFNEPVKVTGTGEVRLIETNSGQIMSKEFTVPYGNNFVSFRFFDFDDRITLQPDTKYHIEMDAGFFEDVFGNLSDAITGSNTWSFTTKKEELTSPRITSLSPTDGATEIPISQQSFKMTLDVDVSKTGTGKVRLVKTSTNETVKSIPIDVKYEKEIAIDFGLPSLDYGTEYHIELDDNSLCKLDGTNLPGFSGKSTWSFTTVPKLTQEMTFSTLDSKKYGDTSFDLEASTSASLPVTYVSSNENIATLSGNTVTLVGAGSIEIAAVQVGNNTYAPVSKSQTLLVTKADLAVAMNNASSTFGQLTPTIAFSYVGFVNGDDMSVLDERPTVSTDLSNLGAGDYDIQITGGSDNNYEITLTSGKLTVEKAEATISISDLEQVANGSERLPVVTTTPAGLKYAMTFDGATAPPTEAGEFTVEVNIEESNYKGSLSDLLKVLGNEEILSVGNDLSEDLPTLYPNPVQDYLYLGGVRNGLVTIHDLSGKKVFTQFIEHSQYIDLTSIETGIYNLIFIDAENREYHRTKIMKE